MEIIHAIAAAIFVVFLILDIIAAIIVWVAVRASNNFDSSLEGLGAIAFFGGLVCVFWTLVSGSIWLFTR